MTALFFSVHLPCLCLSWSWLHERNLWVETPRGRFYCFFSRSTIYFWQTVIYLESNTSALATVAVVPEGLGINFFSLRQNLFKYTTTLSSALDMVGDENMIEALKKSRPDYIVVTSRDSSEYGKARFGIDYAQKMNAWIMRNYVLEKTFGPYPFTAPESGIAIWRNRENSVKSF
jgi:hypothetical protein